MNRDTLATPFLRFGMPAFVNVLWLGLCVSQVHNIEGMLSSGRSAVAVVVIISLVTGIVVCSLLTMGALRKSRAAFWVYLVLLALFVAADVPSIARQGVFVIAVNLIAMGLLITAVVSDVMFGAWAVRKVPQPNNVV